MDARVQRNNAEIIERPIRIYRQRQLPPPRPLSQLEIIQQRVLIILKEQAEEQEREARKRKMEGVDSDTTSRPPEKMTRRRYRMTFTQPINEEVAESVELEGRELATARDLVSILPADQGVILILNPEKSVCRIKLKKNEDQQVIQTVAKPRHNTPNNTYIFTTKYTDPKDLDKVLDSIQPEIVTDRLTLLRNEL